MSDKLPMNLFNRFFKEKTYISSFTRDRVYEFSWKVSGYEFLGKDQNGVMIINVKILLVNKQSLRKSIWGLYSHNDEIQYQIKKKLENLSDFFKIKIYKITVE